MLASCNTGGRWGDGKELMLLPLLPYDLTLERCQQWHCPCEDVNLKRCLCWSDASNGSPPITPKSPSSSYLCQ